MNWRCLGGMLTLCACLFATGGCFQQFVLKQGLKGTVVDESTMTPIAGATVRIQQPLSGGSGQYHSTEITEVREIMTASDGAFVTKPVKAWQFYPLIFPVDRVAGSCLITVVDASHAPFADVFTIHDDPSTRDVGIVKLVPKPAIEVK